MTLRIPKLWLITAAATVAACLAFAVAFYPHGATEEEKYAFAAARKKAYDTIGVGVDLYLKKNEDAAIEKYKEAIAIDPKVGSAYYLLGSKALRDGDYKEAIAQFDLALKYDEYPEHIYNSRGVAKMRLGDGKGAVGDFNAALRLKPSFIQPQVNLGLIQLQQGDAASAKKTFDAVIAGYQRPTDGLEAYAGRGIARAKLGDLAGAEEDFSLVLDVGPGKERILDTLQNRAALRELKGDAAGAQADRAAYARLKNLPEKDKAFERSIKTADGSTTGRESQQ